MKEARQAHADSPVFQLVEDFPDIQRLKTDVFRERVRYSQQVKEQLAAARKGGPDAVRAVEDGLARSPTPTRVASSICSCRIAQ